MTGGAGYIGSHTCVELLQAGHQVAIADSLANAHPCVPDRIRALVGPAPAFHRMDLRDAAALNRLFTEGIAGGPVDAVIHFAGRKAVAESMMDPVGYWDVNVGGTLTLLGAMRAHGVYTLVFSSSATVYGNDNPAPLTEDMSGTPINPYGRTKATVEHLLADLAGSDEPWRLSALRYFNPVGAHPSGTLGEDPADVPNNLMPYVSQVAVGLRQELSVFGGDYDTPDGTGVRDYVHVVDLARGHLAALDFLTDHAGFHVHNLGTGRGYSVLEVVRAFEAASGRPVPYRIVDRRPGDLAAAWADTTRAERELGWRAQFDLDAMCRDAWNWQHRNPHGYRNGG